MLKFKSVYDPIERDDGLRILATRYRGYGMKSDRYDVWMPSLGPSEKLIKNMLKDKISWKHFREKYKHELLSAQAAENKNRKKTILSYGQKYTIDYVTELSKKQNVTVMCHCESLNQECHLRVLEKLITP